MKMFKRVLAAGAALMMAVTGMAMSASAYSYEIALHYVSSLGYGNVTSHTWNNQTITKKAQVFYLNSFTYSNPGAYVLFYNSTFPSDMVNIPLTEPVGLIHYVNASSIGAYVNVNISLQGYGSGGYYAYGSVSG